MKKSDKKAKEEDLIAKEPAAEYGVRRGMDVSQQPLSKEKSNYLPKELLISAVKYAAIAREQKRMISNDEVYDVLATKLGWK